jgi:hypothetical protein
MHEISDTRFKSMPPGILRTLSVVSQTVKPLYVTARGNIPDDDEKRSLDI